MSWRAGRASTGRGCVSGGGRAGLPECDEGDFQVGDIGEHLGSARLIDPRPETCGGLQFRAVGRRDEQMPPRRQDHLRAAVPAGIVDHQRDRMLEIDALIPGKGRQGPGHGSQAGSRPPSP